MTWLARVPARNKVGKAWIVHLDCCHVHKDLTGDELSRIKAKIAPKRLLADPVKLFMLDGSQGQAHEVGRF